MILNTVKMSYELPTFRNNEKGYKNYEQASCSLQIKFSIKEQVQNEEEEEKELEDDEGKKTVKHLLK